MGSCRQPGLLGKRYSTELGKRESSVRICAYFARSDGLKKSSRHCSSGQISRTLRRFRTGEGVFRPFLARLAPGATTQENQSAAPYYPRSARRERRPDTRSGPQNARLNPRTIPGWTKSALEGYCAGGIGLVFIGHASSRVNAAPVLPDFLRDTYSVRRLCA